MANLDWQGHSSVEDSLKEFIETKITDESLTVFFNGQNLPIQTRIGFPENNDWILPCISLYELTTASPRPFVGTTRIIDEIGIVLEVRALNDRMRSDLARWLRDTINSGFPYYEYSPNPSNPDVPLKVLVGRANVDFLTYEPVRLLNADIIDLHRHRITISVQIN